MQGALVFTSCTASKDDSIPIEGRRVEPQDYIRDGNLLQRLVATRKEILSQSEARKGTHETYAFDLYVQTGRMYKGLYEKYYHSLRRTLLDGKMPVQWFFLSGGYGVVNALEPAYKYQATFSRGIASQRRIPYTGKAWNRTLTEICEHIIGCYPSWRVYVFGSRDYTHYLKGGGHSVKVIESTGSAGPSIISPVLDKFVETLLSDRLADFDRAYPRMFKKL